MLVTGHKSIPPGTLVKAGSTALQIELAFAAPTGLTALVPATTAIKLSPAPLTATVGGEPLTGVVGGGDAEVGATSLALATPMSTVVVKGMTVSGHAGIPVGTLVKEGSTASQIELDFTVAAVNAIAAAAADGKKKRKKKKKGEPETPPALGLETIVPEGTVIKFECVGGKGGGGGGLLPPSQRVPRVPQSASSSKRPLITVVASITQPPHSSPAGTPQRDLATTAPSAPSR